MGFIVKLREVERKSKHFGGNDAARVLEYKIEHLEPIVAKARYERLVWLLEID